MGHIEDTYDLWNIALILDFQEPLVEGGTYPNTQEVELYFEKHWTVFIYESKL